VERLGRLRQRHPLGRPGPRLPLLIASPACRAGPAGPGGRSDRPAARYWVELGSLVGALRW
jgi:hypothetical protein